MDDLEGQEVTITLRRDVVLVLEALFSRSDESKEPLKVLLEEPGEWGAVEELLGKLQNHLWEVFSPDYLELLLAARQRLVEKHDWPVERG